MVAHNPPTPDPRVPDQVNGRAPGRGQFKTKPDRGEILAVMEQGNYLVLVELEQRFERDGKKRKVVSHRKRVIPEAKLQAVS
mgnify:CR=1 FL=1